MPEETNLSMNETVLQTENPEQEPETTAKEPDDQTGWTDFEEFEDQNRSKSVYDGVRVKYNGKEMTVPEEQIAPLIQKGLNYDHVYQEMQALRKNGGRDSAVLNLLDRNRAYEAFFKKHRELSPEKLPECVIAAASDGENLEAAFGDYERARLREQIAVLQEELEAQRQVLENRNRAVGSVASETALRPEEDEGWAAFLRG